MVWSLAGSDDEGGLFVVLLGWDHCHLPAMLVLIQFTVIVLGLFVTLYMTPLLPFVHLFCLNHVLCQHHFTIPSRLPDHVPALPLTPPASPAVSVPSHSATSTYSPPLPSSRIQPSRAGKKVRGDYLPMVKNLLRR